jgi:outer membrane protein TolC
VLRAAQPPEAAPPELLDLTLDEALQYALEHYPSARAARERLAGSAAGASIARSAYLPRLDALWQSNLGTTDNVFGQVLPQSVIPALTGPALDAELDEGVYGSAAGALLTWQPLDFGLRKATVIGADAGLARARSDEALVRLEVQRGVAAAYLDAVAAERSVVAARADLERRDLLARTVRALADNDLRPGAEAARADAERAGAQIRVIRAEAAAIATRNGLALALGAPGAEVTLDAGELMERGPQGMAPEGAVAAHPLAVVRQASIDVARAQETVVARTDLPRVLLQSSWFARGTGASPDGSLDTSTSGLDLDRDNWAVGIQLQFPNLFAFASLRARKAQAEASREEAAALYDETVLQIESEQQTADALLDAARAVAAATPVELQAARQSEAQARARYQAGLTNLVEVAEAQSLLARAEATDELARIDVWRALLARAAAGGDLGPFLETLRERPQAP